MQDFDAYWKIEEVSYSNSSSSLFLRQEGRLYKDYWVLCGSLGTCHIHCHALLSSVQLSFLFGTVLEDENIAGA